jgi:hypothetical protein
MNSRTESGLALLAAVLILSILQQMLLGRGQAMQQGHKEEAKDNEELARLYQEDQDDRKADKIDWAIVGARDAKRLARVKELYQSQQLQTGADYLHAAMILQHAEAAEDYLLAHELCIVAVSKGETRAKWLTAATEDRFLWKIGRPQRFGTQLISDGPDKPFRLYKVDGGVTDALRSSLNVPSLKDAEARARKMAEQHKTK